jgi:hypothetical protein
MKPEEKAELKAWAKNWWEGIFLVQGRQVLELLAENESLAAKAEVYLAEIRRLQGVKHDRDS